jgi:hypothetical protein
MKEMLIYIILKIFYKLFIKKKDFFKELKIKVKDLLKIYHVICLILLVNFLLLFLNS